MVRRNPSTSGRLPDMAAVDPDEFACQVAGPEAKAQAAGAPQPADQLVDHHAPLVRLRYAPNSSSSSSSSKSGLSLGGGASPMLAASIPWILPRSARMRRHSSPDFSRSAAGVFLS